jgi:hypothetical protein
LITSNGDAVNPSPDPAQQSELVEFTPTGQFVAQLSVEPTTPGSAFGLALESSEGKIHFAAVDDNLNTLDIWTIHVSGDASGMSKVMPSSQQSAAAGIATDQGVGAVPAGLVLPDSPSGAMATHPMSSTGHAPAAQGTAQLWDLLPEDFWLLVRP